MGPRPRRCVWAAVNDQEPAGLRSQYGSTCQRPGGTPNSSLPPCSELGTVVTDVVILLPLLLTMIAGMFMLGTRISDYMYLNQSTRELGMILSKIPYMYELEFSGEALRTFSINPNEEADPQEKSAAEACIATVSNSSYTGCLNGGDCSCAVTIAEWYAKEFMRMKLMLIEWPITVKVSYTARDTDPVNNPSGLCFINVETRASHRNWAMVGGGEVVAEAHVPYVSFPVPWNSGTCLGPPTSGSEG